MSDEQSSERIWKLMEEIGITMVVSHSGQGDDVRARPMAARPDIEDNAIYFLTDVDTPKDREIEHNSHVCLAFADPKNERFVSVTGIADVIESVELVERLWKATDKVYWKSAQDPKIRVIRVTPDQGEFWEGAGLIATVASMVTAAAKHERPRLGDNEKVPM